MNIKHVNGNKNRELNRLKKQACKVLVIGAMDGVSHDNIHEFIIDNHNWETVFVEPVEKYFDELKQNFEGKANAYFENSAISDKNEKACIYRVDYDAIAANQVPGWANGISSLDRNSAPFSSIEEKFIVSDQINCITIDKLIEKYNILNIDILQIDAEGYDYFILNEILNKQFRPKFINIEIVHMTKFQLEKIINLLESMNYICCVDQSNTNDMFAYQHNLKNLQNYVTSPKIAFFVESKWAFGSIHTSLIKELYSKGIDADLIDWDIVYSKEDWINFNEIYNCFVTVTCSSIPMLLSWGIPCEKIIGISHGYYDIAFLDNETIDNLHKLKKIGTINKNLKTYIEQRNNNVEVEVLQNGIHFDSFYSPVSNSLSSIGYAGAFDSREKNPHAEDWKRGYLAQNLCNQTGTKFVISPSLHYLSMPNFYKTIDSVIVSSTEIEACGLPLMESAAAGRLPISAHVGITTNFNNPPGMILPIEEEAFISNGVEIINELKSNPQKFTRKCKEAQEFARAYYDWSCIIDDWVDFLIN